MRLRSAGSRWGGPGARAGAEWRPRRQRLRRGRRSRCGCWVRSASLPRYGEARERRRRQPCQSGTRAAKSRVDPCTCRPARAWRRGPAQRPYPGRRPCPGRRQGGCRQRIARQQGEQPRDRRAEAEQRRARTRRPKRAVPYAGERATSRSGLVVSLLSSSFFGNLEVRLPGQLNPTTEIVAARAQERHVEFLVLHEEIGVPVEGQGVRTLE